MHPQCLVQCHELSRCSIKSVYNEYSHELMLPHFNSSKTLLFKSHYQMNRLWVCYVNCMYQMQG